MNRKLKIGVFGGARGNTMIQNLLHHPDAELTAVCDKYEPLLRQAKRSAKAAGLHIECFRDFDEFLKCDMDAVVLANYATEHATYAIRCLNAGRHVLSEVLPSETMAQAVELIETVGENRGWSTPTPKITATWIVTFEMWRQYQAGAIGDVTYAEVRVRPRLRVRSMDRA